MRPVRPGRLRRCRRRLQRRRWWRWRRRQWQRRRWRRRRWRRRRRRRRDRSSDTLADNVGDELLAVRVQVTAVARASLGELRAARARTMSERSAPNTRAVGRRSALPRVDGRTPAASICWCRSTNVHPSDAASSRSRRGSCSLTTSIRMPHTSAHSGGGEISRTRSLRTSRKPSTRCAMSRVLRPPSKAPCASLVPSTV